MGTREAERALKQADNNTRLIVVLTLGELKTIRADAVVRQGRMKHVASQASADQTWEIFDTANTESDKSYYVGKWADEHLMSLSPERIEDEWRVNDRGILMRNKDLDKLDDGFSTISDAPSDASPFYPVGEEM